MLSKKINNGGLGLDNHPFRVKNELMIKESEIDEIGEAIGAKIKKIQKEIDSYHLTKGCSNATIKHLETRLRKIKGEISDLEDIEMVEDFLQYGAGGQDPTK